MNLLKGLFVLSVALQSFSAFAQEAEDLVPAPPPPMLTAVEGATVVDSKLVVRGYTVPHACVLSTTPEYQYDRHYVVYFIACDHTPHMYDVRTRAVTQLAATTQLSSILEAVLAYDGYIYLRAKDHTGADINVQTPYYISGIYHRAVSFTVANDQLFLNGQKQQGCYQSASDTYNLGGDEISFLVDCNFHLSAYRASNREIGPVTHSTYVKYVNEAHLDSNGYVTVNVTGTGGSVFDLGTAIYLGAH